LLPTAGGVWVLYILLLVPGVFVALFALSAYPPLDPRGPRALLFGFFLLPVVVQIFTIARKRPNDFPRWSSAVFICSSLALLLLGFVMFLNGRLDRSPSNEVRTTVIRKTVIRGRSTGYHLWVSSWRPGRSLEEFNVGSREFDRAAIGKAVRVELHKGFFGLAWRGAISPE